MKVIAVTNDEVGVVFTRDEAQALVDVCQCIGGPPATTRRIHFQNMDAALKTAGIGPSDCEDMTKNCSPGSIYFT